MPLVPSADRKLVPEAPRNDGLRRWLLTLLLLLLALPRPLSEADGVNEGREAEAPPARVPPEPFPRSLLVPLAAAPETSTSLVVTSMSRMSSYLNKLRGFLRR
ncbi:unnamed protein product [Ectocarpus sp. 8 AP-2014]